MVSVLHRELGYKVENSSTGRLEVMQPGIRIKSKFPVGE